MTFDTLTIILAIIIVSFSIAMLLQSKKYVDNKHINDKLRNRILTLEMDNEALVALRQRNMELIDRLNQLKKQMHENYSIAQFEKAEMQMKHESEIIKLNNLK